MSGAKTPETRPCLKCGATFFASDRRHKFCGRQCRLAAWAATVKAGPKPPRPCERCGTVFTPPPAMGAGGIYCSAECRQVARKEWLAAWRANRPVADPDGYAAELENSCDRVQHRLADPAARDRIRARWRDSYRRRRDARRELARLRDATALAAALGDEQ